MWPQHRGALLRGLGHEGLEAMAPGGGASISRSAGLEAREAAEAEAAEAEAGGARCGVGFVHRLNSPKKKTLQAFDDSGLFQAYPGIGSWFVDGFGRRHRWTTLPNAFV